MDSDVPLSGGNASAFVARVGKTVRKPWTPSTATVQRLIAHVRSRTGDVVPAPLGSDAEGRQVLEFVPGTETMTEMPITPAAAERVGAIIRTLHDASASFERRTTDVWSPAMRVCGDDLIGHNDLGPWNLIRDIDTDRWVFIDWDGAGPTTRAADLAYAARAFAQLEPGHELDASIPLLRAILVGYDASSDITARILPAMIERTEAMRDLLLGSAVSGTQPWADMAISGHAAFWSGAADYLHRYSGVISSAIA